MSTVLSLNSLARKCDKAVPTVMRRINRGEIVPISKTDGGRLLFDASRIEEYKMLFRPAKG